MLICLQCSKLHFRLVPLGTMSSCCCYSPKKEKFQNVFFQLCQFFFVYLSANHCFMEKRLKKWCQINGLETQRREFLLIIIYMYRLRMK